MALRIEYYRDGKQVGQVLEFGTLDDVLRGVNRGMIKYDADQARVVDLDKFGLEVHRVER